MLVRGNIFPAIICLVLALTSWLIGYGVQGAEDAATADFWFLFDAVAKFCLSAFSVIIINHYHIRTATLAFLFMAACNLADEVLPWCSPTKTGINEYITAALVIALTAYRIGFIIGQRTKNYARSS